MLSGLNATYILQTRHLRDYYFLFPLLPVAPPSGGPNEAEEGDAIPAEGQFQPSRLRQRRKHTAPHRLPHRVRRGRGHPARSDQSHQRRGLSHSGTEYQELSRY